MTGHFFKHLISRLTVVLIVVFALAFVMVLRGNAQEGGGPGIFGGRTPADLLDKHEVPGGLSSYGFGTGVGGVAFGAVAQASRSGLFLVGLEYHPEYPDGSRFLAIVEDAGLQRVVTIDVPDWQMLPITHYAYGGQHAAMTLFGKMTEPSEDTWMRTNGYDIINFERALRDSLLGLRLFQADVLILSNESADLPRTSKGYVLGFGEESPDIAANQAALSSLYTSIQSYGSQPFQSYIITDRGTGVTFDATAKKLTLKGNPYWYCWREVPMTSEARSALWQESENYANAKLNAEEDVAWTTLGPEAFYALYTAAYEQERFDEYFDEYISPRLMQGLPALSDQISTEIAALGGINPAVYEALSQTMRLSALCRLARNNDPARFASFIDSLKEANSTPCLRTPTGYKPNSPLVLPDNLVGCSTPSTGGTTGHGSTTSIVASGGTHTNTSSNPIASGGTLANSSLSATATGGTLANSSLIVTATGGTQANSMVSATATGGGPTNAIASGGTAVSSNATDWPGRGGSVMTSTTGRFVTSTGGSVLGFDSRASGLGGATTGIVTGTGTKRTPTSPTTSPSKPIDPALTGTGGTKSTAKGTSDAKSPSNGCDCAVAGVGTREAPSAFHVTWLWGFLALCRISRKRSRK